MLGITNNSSRVEFTYINSLKSYDNNVIISNCTTKLTTRVYIHCIITTTTAVEHQSTALEQY